MTAVLDSSALVSQLVGWVDESHSAVFDTDLVAPDILLVEAASGLRRSERRGLLSREVAVGLLQHLFELPVEIVTSLELLERAFELRHNLTIQDACYVALAEEYQCALITSDARLARAPGVTVPVTLV